jgi:geranylgeranyl pyrophosphate synthase
MEVFGQHVGLAFQVVDDVLDIVGDDAMGKPQGTDIKEGKPTLAVIRARDQLSGKDKKSLLSIYKKKRRTKADISKAIKLVESTDGVDHAMKRARTLIREALKETDYLDEGPYKDILVKLSKYIVERDI